MNLAKRVVHKIKRELISVAGPKRNCNVCGTSFRGKFIPLSDMYFQKTREAGYPYTADDAETINYREYECPVCHCSDRDRLYALYLESHLEKNKKYKLLDIAPAQALREKLQKNSLIQYRSSDLFMEDVDDKIDLMDMNIYPDGSFNIFICSHVLEHVPDDIRAMRELYRVLSQDGFGIAMVPIVLPLKEIDEDIHVTDIKERWRRFGQGDHVRLYSKKGFVERLQKTGFKVTEITIKDFSLEDFILHGISPKSVIYIVAK